jgi:putative lipoprotein
MYRERIALPPDTVFTATLQDVSLQDAPAKVISTFTIKSPKASIKFSIPYDPAKIVAGHTYSVRGTITRGDKLLFTTDTMNPVLTRGAGTDVELKLVASRR